MLNAAARTILSIEDPLYRRYLEIELAGEHGASVVSVGLDRLPEAVAEDPESVLLLQSDTAEPEILEVARRFRRVFADKIRILILSADYATEEEAISSADSFLHYPASATQVRDALKRLGDRTRRILVIDDSRLVHSHLVPPLKAEGYEVAEAFDGQEGLDLARQLAPDLVITDIEMPKLNGFDVSAGIRATPEIAGTYVIMSSTLGSAADQQKGFASGVDEYIIKPVVIPELLDRIRKVFRSGLSGREIVLVVDRDEQLVGNIGKSLIKQGFVTRSAATIRQAMRTLRRASIDVVISATDFTDGNVIDLFANIRLLPESGRPDVLIMTGRDSPADAKMVTNAGAAGILSKPFTMDGLLAAVERAVANRRARIERGQLEKYVSKASLRMALEKSILGGAKSIARADRKRASVFFSDIANFTARCERYNPREIVTQINTLFDTMTRVIVANEGDIDKFIGDACMAFWMSDDPLVAAERSLRTVVTLRQALAEMNAKDPVLSKDPIMIRMGINSGEVVLCDIGSVDARIDLTIIGDVVNVASRLESASKQYGLDNLIGESTILPFIERFGARVIDWVRVKGKSEPVACYELLGLKSELTQAQQDLVRTFEAGMKLYRDGMFLDALSAFMVSERLERNQRANDKNPSRIFQKRCKELAANPPRDWEGVWELLSK
jgi:DNA-binding response OmpR family regulator